MLSSNALHKNDRIVVLKQPGESPKQAAERYMCQHHPSTAYYMWDDDSTFDVWAPGLFDFTLSVD